MSTGGVLDENRSATCTSPGFDVHRAIPDHPRAREVEAELAGSGEKQPGSRLPAFAGLCERNYRTSRVVIARSESLAQLPPPQGGLAHGHELPEGLRAR